MKNSTRLFYSGSVVILLILLMMPFFVHAQEVTATDEGGFFGKISGFIKGKSIWFIVGIATQFLGRKGYLVLIKAFAKKTAEVSIQLSEAFGALGIASGKLDQAILDDKTVDQNTLMEAFEAGKHVIVETNDVIMTFKPKPLS